MGRMVISKNTIRTTTSSLNETGHTWKEELTLTQKVKFLTSPVLPSRSPCIILMVWVSFALLNVHIIAYHYDIHHTYVLTVFLFYSLLWEGHYWQSPLFESVINVRHIPFFEEVER